MVPGLVLRTNCMASYVDIPAYIKQDEANRPVLPKPALQ